MVEARPMKTPIIPPYTPATGITQSPARDHQRRPDSGLYAVWEQRLEARYLAEGLRLVERMWEHYPARDIAVAISNRTKYRCDTKLVYSLKQRLDTARRNGGE